MIIHPCTCGGFGPNHNQDCRYLIMYGTDERIANASRVVILQIFDPDEEDLKNIDKLACKTNVTAKIIKERVAGS